MRGPDFIIAGAMRSGTTALAEALGEHPGVFVTCPKEPNYFAVAHGALSFRGPGDQWFARQNTSTWESYCSLFPPASEGVARGEASAMYLALPGVAADIAACRPQAKIVLMLRDPVARAFSAWSYLRAGGRETVEDFGVALDREETRRRDGYGPMWWFVGASRYELGLRAFHDAFPASSILVITTEELRENPEQCIDRVCGFLGVPGEDFHPEALRRSVNASGVPRSGAWSRILYPADNVRAAASKVAPPVVRRVVQSLRRSATRPVEPMSESCRSRLLEQLSDVGQHVATLTGADTVRWPSSQRE